jgi:chromosome partitioning protein
MPKKSKTMPRAFALPKVWSFVNQKGGAGKSTGAIHAADWLRRQGYSVTLVDADGQQSSSSWAQELGLACRIMNDPELLIDELPHLSQACDVVIVDGPGNASEITKAILIRSDLVLIPCRDSMIDLASTGKIVQFVRQAREIRKGLPIAAIYLNAVKEKSVLVREAREALQTSVLPLLHNMLPDRQCIKDSPGQGSTVFQLKGTSPKAASTSYSNLFTEALQLLEKK